MLKEKKNLLLCTVSMPYITSTFDGKGVASSSVPAAMHDERLPASHVLPIHSEDDMRVRRSLNLSYLSVASWRSVERSRRSNHQRAESTLRPAKPCDAASRERRPRPRCGLVQSCLSSRTAPPTVCRLKRDRHNLGDEIMITLPTSKFTWPTRSRVSLSNKANYRNGGSKLCTIH